MLNQNPEQIARDQIDLQLLASGWIIQDKNKINLVAALGIALTTDEIGEAADTVNKKLLEIHPDTSSFTARFWYGVTIAEGGGQQFYPTPYGMVLAVGFMSRLLRSTDARYYAQYSTVARSDVLPAAVSDITHS